MDREPVSRRLWITRTRPQADATAERLIALGWIPVIAPVLETRLLADVELGSLDGEIAGAPDALAFTSQTAVSAYAALRPDRDLPVYVVGEATGRAALDAGFVHVDAPPGGQGGDVADLADRIAGANPRPSRVLNPTARAPAADLRQLLARRGVAARSVAVYETVETPLEAPPTELHGLLVHSPRGARAVARLIDPDQAARLKVWAISEAAARPLRAIGFERIFVAEQPNEQALLAQLGD